MINKVIIVGRVVRTPELIEFANGSMIKFSLATNEKYKDRNGEKVENTEWHNISVFGEKLIEIVEKYVNKGDLIYVEGKLKTRMWEKDGVKHYATDIVLNGFNSTLKMLSGKSSGENKKYQKKEAPMEIKSKDLDDPEGYESGDMPF